MAPWVHLAVAATGVVTPCCEAKGNFGHTGRQTVDEIWCGNEFQEFRSKLLRDEPDPRCAKCYEVEQTGGSSLRQAFNARFAHHRARATPAAPPPPVSLDVRFSNLCNFSCRMCWHGSSSKWFADARALGWTVGPTALITAWPSKEEGALAISPLLAEVEGIYWAGGEPLLMEEHYAILEALLAAGRNDVILRYNSNLSELHAGKFDILALWQRFRSVELQISIDGTSERGELIRHGLSWPRLLANIAEVKNQCPHVQISFGITVSVLNVFVLDELHRNLTALDCCGPDDFAFHPLQEAPHYNIQILPPHLKLEAARRLRAYARTLPDATSLPRFNSV
jgi:MoaA/NifB/PqqE/SkfB family radical SAM enzyme